MRKITLKTMFLAAAAALGLGISSAYADGGAGPTQFTSMETQLAAKAQGRSVPQATLHSTAGTFVYSTSPRSQGTWLSTRATEAAQTK